MILDKRHQSRTVTHLVPCLSNSAMKNTGEPRGYQSPHSAVHQTPTKNSWRDAQYDSLNQATRITQPVCSIEITSLC